MKCEYCHKDAPMPWHVRAIQGVWAMMCMYCGRETSLESDRWHVKCGNEADVRRRDGKCAWCGVRKPPTHWDRCTTCFAGGLPYQGYPGRT